MYAEAKHAFKKHGVLVDGLAVDVAAMQQQKAAAVDGLNKGIEGLFQQQFIVQVHKYIENDHNLNA